MSRKMLLRRASRRGLIAVTPPAPPVTFPRVDGRVTVRGNTADATHTEYGNPDTGMRSLLVGWVELQPTEAAGASGGTWTTLDASVTAAHNNGWELLLRVTAGIEDTPPWVFVHPTAPVPWVDAVSQTGPWPVQSGAPGAGEYPVPLPWTVGPPATPSDAQIRTAVDNAPLRQHYQGFLAKLAGWLNGPCPVDAGHTRATHVPVVPCFLPTAYGTEMTTSDGNPVGGVSTYFKSAVQGNSGAITGWNSAGTGGAQVAYHQAWRRCLEDHLALLPASVAASVACGHIFNDGAKLALDLLNVYGPAAGYRCYWIRTDFRQTYLTTFGGGLTGGGTSPINFLKRAETLGVGYAIQTDGDVNLFDGGGPETTQTFVGMVEGLLPHLPRLRFFETAPSLSRAPSTVATGTFFQGGAVATTAQGGWPGGPANAAQYLTGPSGVQSRLVVDLAGTGTGAGSSVWAGSAVGSSPGTSEGTAAGVSVWAGSAVGAAPSVAGNELIFMTASQIAELSTTSAAALRAKVWADRVRDGTTGTEAKISDTTNVNTRVGAVALTTALWWLRTGDAAYLAPLKTYILNNIKPPSTVQALNEWRALHGMLTAILLLRRAGEWNDSATLPNHGGITWSEWMLGGATYPSAYNERRIDTSTGQRWRWLSPTAGTSTSQGSSLKSSNNWGAVARAGELAYGVLIKDMGQTTAGDAIINANRSVLKQYLGDAGTGLPDFFSSGNYIASWNNRGAFGSGSQFIPNGIGDFDAGAPGLDGVIVNDIDRGGTGYNATAAHWGATGSGLTYPLEAADFLWAQAAWFLNAGEPVRTWGQNGNGLVRANARLARQSPQSAGSQFDAGDSGSSVYHGIRVAAARTSGLADTGYGTVIAASGSVDGLPRSVPYWDWLTEGTSWAQ